MLQRVFGESPVGTGAQGGVTGRGWRCWEAISRKPVFPRHKCVYYEVRDAPSAERLVLFRRSVQEQQ